MVSIFNNIDLKKYNTFGISAKCKTLVEYSSVNDLVDFLKSDYSLDTPILHIGGGSNLVFTKDFDGVILHSTILGKEVVKDCDKVRVKVGAGEKLDDFINWCVKNEYYGLENLSYIPGEVGAAAVQNVGAYGVEVSDYIDYVEVLNISTLEIERFSTEECRYSYRNSVFKDKFKGQYIVLYVGFVLFMTFNPNLSYGILKNKMEGLSITHPTALQVRDIVIEIRKEKLPEPSKLGSAGSFFMNPIISSELFDALIHKYPDMPNFDVAEGKKISAGWLIEQCGWKGVKHGNVGVYEKQALVIVNYGGANGQDVKDFADRIVADVEKKFGIRLIPEANFI